MRTQSERSRASKASLLAGGLGLALLACLLAFHVHLALKAEESRRESGRTAIRFSQTVVDSYANRAQKLAQMILLDADVSSFIYQGRIAEGSSDIQKAIDAMASLPSMVSVNSFVDDIYISSKRSGYLLSSLNLFFDPEGMYSLYAFDGLSARQFQSRYLASRSQGFLPAATAMVKGHKRSVVPYVRSFPLAKPSTNSGKVMILLDRDFIEERMGALPLGRSGWFCVTDDKGVVIAAKGAGGAFDQAWLEALGPLRDGSHLLGAGAGRSLVLVFSGAETGLRYYFLVSGDALGTGALAASLALGVLAALGAAAAPLLLLVRGSRSEAPLQQAPSRPLEASALLSVFAGGGSLSDRALEEMVRLLCPSCLLDGRTAFVLLGLVPCGGAGLLDSAERSGELALRLFGGRARPQVRGGILAVLVWSGDAAVLESDIDAYWEALRRSGAKLSLAVSDPARDAARLREAPFQVEAVRRSLLNEGAAPQMRSWRAVSQRKDLFVCAKETQKALLAAVEGGDRDGARKILETIRLRNYGQRRLGDRSSRALMDTLYGLAVALAAKGGSRRLPSRFEVFDDCQAFFLAEAELGGRSQEELDRETQERIMEFLRENCFDPNLTLSRAAAELGLKESWLYRFMGERTGRSWARHIEDLRLDRAMEMLQSDPSLPVGTVALGCGYSNPQTFRRAFKKRFGRLPSDLKGVTR